PKKGLDRLVRAWAHVESAHPEWRLRVVGPDEVGHPSGLVALAAGVEARDVSVVKSGAGGAKIAAHQRADLFVLPTLNESFAITVAEALAAATPALGRKAHPGVRCRARAAAGGSITTLNRLRPRLPMPWS